MRKPMDIDFERCTSGIEFEEWVKELLGQLRMKAERVVKNDCGIDIIAIAAVNKNTTKRFYIQCKYYNRFLGKGRSKGYSQGRPITRSMGSQSLSQTTM